MSTLKHVSTDKAPAAIGPYSQAVVANGFVYTAGQIAFDPKTMEIVPGDVQVQTDRVLQNLKAVLEEAGSGFDKVVKTTVFLKDMNDFSKMNEIYAKHFGNARPARSAVEVARLPRDVLVEIEAKHSAELRYVKTNGERKRRILAVVENTQGGEEACVFVLKRRVGNAAAIYEVLPIYSDFRLAVSQSKPVSQEYVADIGKSDLTLRLSDSQGGHEVKMETSALDSLQSLLVELKRLMSVAQQKKYTRDGGTHSWVRYYEQSRITAAEAAKEPDPSEISQQSAVMSNPFINFDSAVSASNLKGIKEAWAAKEMRAREARFVEYKSQKIFVGTWNINGQAATESLVPWLQTTSEEKPAIYALGFQELDLSTEAYILVDTAKEDEWSRGIEFALQNEYVKIASKQLVGMLIMLYVKKEEVDAVSEISALYVGTGILGMMGNKGATAIRVRYHSTYLTFVNCHLAADTSMVDRRNQDFADICRRLIFPLPMQYKDYTAYAHSNPWVTGLWDVAADSSSGAGNVAAMVAGSAAAGVAPGKSAVTIFDGDHLFWMGDLNYRVPIPDSEAKAMLSAGSVKELLEFDQLTIERRAKRVFQGFDEGPIEFPPTYKFDLGTSRYDTSEKRRSPSWCDRILWFRNPLRANEPEWLKLIWYRSVMELTLSDHKPVMALFEAKIRHIHKENLLLVQDEITRELDKFENDALPVLELSENVIEFGEIKFGVACTKKLIVENKGQVIAQYQFVAKPGDKSFSKPWCYVNPPISMLLPGDKLNINITILVDASTSPALNFGMGTLDDILIFHIENGKDHFVSVSGKWLPSCFGNDLGVLCRMVKPVREVGVDGTKKILEGLRGKGDGNKKEELAEGGLDPLPPVADEEMRLSIPKEVWRLVDFVYKFGMDVDNLFLSSGDQNIAEYIRECLDTGAEFDLSILLADPDDPDAPLSPTDSESSTLKVKNVDLDVDLLLKTTPTSRPPAQVALGSASDISSDAVQTPRPRGRASAVHSAADTLMKLLGSFVDPVVPYSMYHRCVQEGYHTFVAARQLLQHFPSLNYNCFVYIVGFLKEVIASYKGRGELSAEKLGRNALMFL
ncbi:hypothetical protein HK104_008910 [Borealophlyctis nickersoniae]|nr:hypothetical protein HK104_008910 [Borealophlyctis nickersoniae]